MRKGKRYGCKATNGMVIVRGAEPIYHPTLPVRTGFMKELVARFGTGGGDEIPVVNDKGERVFGPDGNPAVYVALRGNYFHSGEAQEEHGWTDEEREMVENRLDHLCETQPEYWWHLEEQAPSAPWPTYDDTHHFKIPTLAAELGLVEQAFAYETRTKNRESVVTKLAELLAAQSSDAQAEQELTAVA